VHDGLRIYAFLEDLQKAEKELEHTQVQTQGPEISRSSADIRFEEDIYDLTRGLILPTLNKLK
jgi:hypothetical protein